MIAGVPYGAVVLSILCALSISLNIFFAMCIVLLALRNARLQFDLGLKQETLDELHEAFHKRKWAIPPLRSSRYGKVPPGEA